LIAQLHILRKCFSKSAPGTASKEFTSTHCGSCNLWFPTRTTSAQLTLLQKRQLWN